MGSLDTCGKSIPKQSPDYCLLYPPGIFTRTTDALLPRTSRPASLGLLPLSGIVLLLVNQESVLVIKGLAADGTAEGAIPDVALPVCDEVGLLAEAAITVGAGVGPLTCVDAPVGHQVGLLTESFATVGTHIGLLACVDASVRGQVGLVAESLAAVWAHEGPLRCMVPPVGCQVAAL